MARRRRKKGDGGYTFSGALFEAPPVVAKPRKKKGKGSTGTEEQPGKKPRASVGERFLEYHKARPDTYHAFLRQAMRLRAMGHRHISAQYIVDYLSFESPHDMRPEAGFKFDRSFSAFYARLVILADPSFKPYFEQRKSVADELDMSGLVA